VCASNHACVVARPGDCLQFMITALLPAGHHIFRVHLFQLPVANVADCVPYIQYLFVFSISSRSTCRTRLISFIVTECVSYAIF